MLSLGLDVGRSVKANLLRDAGLLSAIDKAAEHRGLTRSEKHQSRLGNCLIGNAKIAAQNLMGAIRRLRSYVVSPISLTVDFVVDPPKRMVRVARLAAIKRKLNSRSTGSH